MSAVLRLTQEALVIDKGRLMMRAPTAEAVDYYLSAGHADAGERIWEADEVPENGGTVHAHLFAIERYAWEYRGYASLDRTGCH